MKYKIGDWVIFTNKKYSDDWKEETGISLYGKLAKIIYIDKKNEGYPYLLEFKNWINGHDGERRGKDGHCWWFYTKSMFQEIKHLKFKKWINK